MVIQRRKTMKIFIANKPAALAAAINPFPATATVEAEFGDAVVEGSVVTLAHHGPRKGQQCPCHYATAHPEVQAAGISHLDLDTLGGIMAILGQPLGADKDTTELLWSVAARTDLQGLHKQEQILWEESHRFGNLDISSRLAGEVEGILWAIYAHLEANRIQAPSDGAAMECTEAVNAAIRCIQAAARQDLEVLGAGRRWAAAKAALESSTFVCEDEGIVLRYSSTGEFVNHLYTPTSLAVVALNEKYHKVTLSLADPIPGVSCREIAQGLWGPEAGGHDGIAGSPYGREMTRADAAAAFEALDAAITAATA